MMFFLATRHTPLRHSLIRPMLVLIQIDHHVRACKMTSLLRVDDVDVLSLDFSKVSFDDDVDVKEYETIEKEEAESSVQESQGQTGNDFVILDDGKPLSDSEDEGPLVAPRNKASGDGRAHTPQKISKLTRRRASPLSRPTNLIVKDVKLHFDSERDPGRKRKKKLGRRKQRIYENNNLLNAEAFWKTFGRPGPDDDGLSIDFLKGYDNLGITLSRPGGGFKEILNNPEALDDFLSCKTFRSNAPNSSKVVSRNRAAEEAGSKE